MTSLHRDGQVFVLDLGDGDQRFNGESLAELNEALDEVESAPAPAALVTTARGKIWHNGLDLDYLGTLGGDAVFEFVGAVQQFFGRMLLLPVPTIAAMQGHAFAGGAMFALSHDVRVMREDRGYFCLPEIDLGMTFAPGMIALIDAKVPQPAKHRLVTTGERIGAVEAAHAGVIDATASEDRVLADAVDRAGMLAGKAGPTLAGIRTNFYPGVLAACGVDH